MQQLLALLADGEFHSGEALGAALGVSRSAVWKQLSALRKRGLALEVVAGRGYRLLPSLQPWRESELRTHMSARANILLQHLRIEQCVGSSNDVVMAMLRAGNQSGVVCLAEEQTAGRGRRGREWLSPWCGSFYGSVGWIYTQGLAVVEGLSLAVGLAVVRALQRYGVTGVQLKWPNDIVVGDAKLGGILLELHAESEGVCQLVVGLGLNLLLPPDAQARLAREVIDVASLHASPLRRNVLGALLLDELLLLLESYPQSGFAALQAEWSQYDALHGKPVQVSGLESPLWGVACGVNAAGALLLQTASGLRTLHGGEISVRKSEA